MLTLEGLAHLAETYRAELEPSVAEFDLRGVPFRAFERPHLMGVVNLSPDSWYRESVALSTEAAVRRGVRLKAEGAHIVDLGAESTLAHAARADEAAQILRLVPVVRALSEAGVLVSIETYLPRVAAACFEAGAAVLNLTGPQHAPELHRIVAAHEGAVILCHVEGAHVRDVGDFDVSGDVVGRMRDGFAREIDRAHGIGVERMWIDPGLGFYYRNLADSRERVRHQIATFLQTFRLRSLGWPTCHALPHAFEYFEDEVRSAEPLFAVLALLGKCDLLRTHELTKVRAVVRTLETVVD
jgi:dihydropteroate synthase